MLIRDIQKKSMNNSVASRFFCTYSFDDLTDSQNLWSYGLISLKTVPIFLKIFFIEFRFDTVEKQSIINHNSKNYASVVLSDSKITFLEEKEDAVMSPKIK